MCIYTHRYIYIYVYMYVRVCVYIYIYIYIYVYIYIYIYIFVLLYIYIYIYIYIHTYTHTCNRCLCNRTAASMNPHGELTVRIRPFFILRIVRPIIVESKFRNDCAKKLDGELRKPTSFVYEFV